MSKMDTNVSIPFGKELTQNNEFPDSLDQMDDNFDAFNDETFGDMSTDWESDHEKLLSATHQSLQSQSDHLNDNKTLKNLYFNDSHRTEEDSHFVFDDIVTQSISKLGLEDEEFEDPAIMTFARSAKPLNANPMVDPNRRLSRSSPPPPAILSYEEYSASPKTQSIWSATQMDSNLTPTINSANIRTLEDIENDLINKNTDHLNRLSTIQRPIRAEDLEANLLHDSRNGSHNQMPAPDKGWSPFGNSPMNEFMANGRMPSEMLPNFENNFRSDLMSNNSQQNQNQRESAINVVRNERVDTSMDMPRNYKPGSPIESYDPLLKAQTLSEIERQLISTRSPTQRINIPQNVIPNETMNRPIRPMPGPVAQSPTKPFGMQFRPQMLGQNRMPNMYNNIRPPVMHLAPGMHPAIVRTMFAPALIPNSQHIYPFPLQTRPIMHPLLHPLHIQQQQQLNQMQRHSLQCQPYRQHRYYDDDDYSGLMTQSEKEFLIRIQRMQTEMKDPYVDDYYYVTYSSRMIAAKAAKDSESKTTPSLLLPERPKPVTEPETAKYIPEQFEGTLGKIQVSNVNCPRKLLDCKLNKTDVNPNDTQIDNKVINKSEVQRFRKLLLQIEKLYVILINIDDEDKRIGALPEDKQLPHLETRRQLCHQLFKGLTNETKDKINLEVIQIRKGLILLFRSLSYLSDESQRTVILSDLMFSNTFRQFVIKSKVRLNFSRLLVNAINDIRNHENILKIVSNLNISLIIKSEYGQAIVEALINQWEKLEIDVQNQSKWSVFVNNVLDELADDLPEMRKLCSNHLRNISL